MTDDRPHWFAPKRYGYGSGLPIAWQGWAVGATYLTLVLIAVFVLQASVLAMLSIIVSATVILLLVSARTTRGGWRWRWGEDD